MPNDFTSSVTNHELNEMVVCISFSFFFGFFNLGNFHCCNSEFALVIIRQHVAFLYSKIQGIVPYVPQFQSSFAQLVMTRDP